MKLRWKSFGFAAMVFIVGWSRVDAQQISDTEPPKLVDFQISPAVVDISTNVQRIVLTARITDDLSGLGVDEFFGRARASVFFQPPGGFPQRAEGRFYPGSPTSGTVLDGVYETEVFMTIMRTGVWSVVSFILSDQVGNTVQLSPGDLRSKGLPISFTVIGSAQDNNPPDILSLSIEPNVFDNSTTNQTVTIQAHLREDVLWFGGYDENGQLLPAPGIVSFTSPSRRQVATGSFYGDVVSGQVNDGVFRTVLNFPRYSEPGVWTLASLRLTDHAGNAQLIDLSAALTRGFPTEITVLGQGDTNGPTLQSFDYFPRRIGLPTTNQTVFASVRYRDNLSGFGGLNQFGNPFFNRPFFRFLSPSGRQTVEGFFSETADDESGSLIATNSFVFPRYCETGIWTLFSFSLRDGVGNPTNLDATAMRRLGFPTQIAVGIEPLLNITQQGDTVLLSWPSWGADFRLESRGLGLAESWTAAPGSPAAIGDEFVFAVPEPQTSRLYRLSQ